MDISYARQRDEKEVLPSSVVGDLQPRPCLALAAESIHLVMEGMDDMSAIPLPTAQTVRGGTSIIRNQSACPFRAFATHRLGISALEETAPGIEPGSKGSLIHLALEYIWRTLKRRAALEALSDDATVALIDAASDQAGSKA